MEDKVNYARVGAFVLVLGAALIVGTLWLATGMGSKKQYDTYQSIIAESVAGLNIDAPVKYLGVDVGKVSQIVIDPENPRQVRLTLLIERGTPILVDTEAVLKTQGLTGIANVELSGGSDGAAPMVATTKGEIPIIRSKPSLSARLENVLTSVLANVDRVSNNLNEIFNDENRLALKSTLADTATLMRAIAAQQSAIGSGIANASRTAGNTARASEQLAPVLARIAASATAVETMGNATTTASDGVGRTAEVASSSLQRIRDETLTELSRAMLEFNELAASLRRLSEQTERSPNSLIMGAPPRRAGPGEKERK